MAYCRSGRPTSSTSTMKKINEQLLEKIERLFVGVSGSHKKCDELKHEWVRAENSKVFYRVLTEFSILFAFCPLIFLLWLLVVQDDQPWGFSKVTLVMTTTLVFVLSFVLVGYLTHKVHQQNLIATAPIRAHYTKVINTFAELCEHGIEQEYIEALKSSSLNLPYFILQGSKSYARRICTRFKNPDSYILTKNIVEKEQKILILYITLIVLLRIQGVEGSMEKSTEGQIDVMNEQVFNARFLNIQHKLFDEFQNTPA
jgi:hypothetical protein